MLVRQYVKNAFRDVCTKGASSEMNGHLPVKEQECGV